MILNNISIVLKDTTHPGNIGSSARAMKTMGITQLRLACPKVEINEVSVAMASGASDVLDNALTFSTFSDAIADFHYVFALTARRRDSSPKSLTARDGACEIINCINRGGKVAVLLGGERSGLENSDIQESYRVLEIPTNPDYSSLNLSQAVQIICYEIRQASLLSSSAEATRDLPTREEFENMLTHLEQALHHIGLPKPNDTRPLLPRVKRLLTRADLDSSEVRLLRGIYRSILHSVNSQK